MYSPADITVGLRTFNRHQHLCEALESVLNQSIAGFSVIILDDSSDAFVAEQNRIICGESGVRYVRPNERLIYGGATLNRVVEEAETELVAFLDDDDRWHARKLELQLECLNKAPFSAFVTCSQRNFIGNFESSSEKETIFRSSMPPIGNLLHRSGRSFGPPSAVILKKSVVAAIGGFDSEMERGACQLMFRKAYLRFGACVCSEICLDYLVHNQSITGNFGGIPGLKNVRARLHKLRVLEAEFDAYPVERMREEAFIVKMILGVLSLGELIELKNTYSQSMKIFPYWFVRLVKRLWRRNLWYS